MHLVLPLKLGVTKWYQSCVDCRMLAYIEMVEFKDFIIIEAFLITCFALFLI
jgi:hypothetical protein